jgi:hypothetical protein
LASATFLLAIVTLLGCYKNKYKNIAKVFMLTRNSYAIQPYQAGGKNKKSLALIIPSGVVHECQIDTSTIFLLKVDEKKKPKLFMIDLPRGNSISGNEP